MSIIHVPASYIFSSGSDGLYYAKNGETGKVDYTGSDASTVIMAAMSAAKTGSTFFFMPGYYANINVSGSKQGFKFIGSGRGNETSPYNGTVIECATSGGLDLSNTADERWFNYVSDFTFNGANRTGVRGINTKNQNTNDKAIVHIERCWFTGFKSSGSNAINITNNERVMVKDCMFASPASGGTLIILGSDSSYYAGNSHVKDCYFTIDSSVTGSHMIEVQTVSNEADQYTFNGNGIYARDYPNYFVHLNTAGANIKQVHMYNNRMEYMCLLRTTGGGYASDVEIFGNVIDTGTNLDYAINIPANSRGWNIHNNYISCASGRVSIYDLGASATYPCQIHDNIFYGGGTYISGSGTTTKIYNNQGYITENKGYASVSTGGNVAHGLSAAATTINITPSGSSPVPFSSANSGSTGFYVYHTGSGAFGFYWRAYV